MVDTPLRGAHDELHAVRAQLTRLVRRREPWHLPGLGPATQPGARRAAVLVLFGGLDDRPSHHRGAAVPTGVDVLLLGRAATLKHHPGEVSFPGGRVDPEDSGPEAAALREAVEETGLDPAGVDVLGALDDLPLPISRHLVTPVVAWWARPSTIGVVDLAESAAVFRAPVADLLDPANRRTVTVTRGPTTHKSPGFLVPRADEAAGPTPGDRPVGEPDDEPAHVVWGFTALVLDQMFDRLGWTEPWDRSRTIPAPR